MDTAKFIAAVLAAALTAPGPAEAQLGGLLSNAPPSAGVALESTLGRASRTMAPRVGDPAEGVLGEVRNVSDDALSELRRRTVEGLLREHPRSVDADPAGQPVVRAEVLALSPSPEGLARAEATGFRVTRRSDLDVLGLDLVVLRPPRGASVAEAVRRLRDMDPQGRYEFNHLYQVSGSVSRAPARGQPEERTATVGSRLGLIDGSAARAHPALKRSRVIQKAFGPGGPRVTDHATAVASLLVGDAGPFRGAAPRADLYVADVYGPTPTGGSAEAIARGLAWLAQNDVRVTNISLVGPANRLIEAAVRAAGARGMTIVAAVGNDGPAAPPLYPAAYPSVVAVTAVDARQRLLPEAGRGAHVDFAAPGSDMAAAGAGGGYRVVRGTSFAAPIVAGRIARDGAEGLGRQAADLGAPGPDPAYGLGLVAFDARIEPSRVRATGLALSGP